MQGSSRPAANYPQPPTHPQGQMPGSSRPAADYPQPKRTDCEGPIEGGRHSQSPGGDAEGCDGVTEYVPASHASPRAAGVDPRPSHSGVVPHESSLAGCRPERRLVFGVGEANRSRGLAGGQNGGPGGAGRHFEGLRVGQLYGPKAAALRTAREKELQLQVCIRARPPARMVQILEGDRARIFEEERLVDMCESAVDARVDDKLAVLDHLAVLTKREFDARMYAVARGPPARARPPARKSKGPRSRSKSKSKGGGNEEGGPREWSNAWPREMPVEKLPGGG
eukprot:32907-Prorocentrum_minimum.AAC.1